MAKVLVTGGTGFVGSHISRALAERGDELRLLLRPRADTTGLEGVEFERVNGDITDRRAVRRAMKGVERVFHSAGRFSLQVGRRKELFEVNVTGTRLVMEEALRAEVERVVHSSSVAAIGPAPPHTAADESQLFTAGSLGIAFVNAKHEAEVEAMRFAAKGLPVVVVNSAWVFGPGDHHVTSTSIVRRFLQREIPVYVDGGLNIVDVRDVAQGHLLADRKGKVGERYILGGRNFTLDRLYADLGRISGVAPPATKMPGRVVLAFAEAAHAAGLPSPATPDEVRWATQWWTYRSTKACKQLGFGARPHEETLEDTVAWHLERLGGRSGPPHRRMELPLRLAGRAARLGARITGQR